MNIGKLVGKTLSGAVGLNVGGAVGLGVAESLLKGASKALIKGCKSKEKDINGLEAFSKLATCDFLKGADGKIGTASELAGMAGVTQRMGALSKRVNAAIQKLLKSFEDLAKAMQQLQWLAGQSDIKTTEGTTSQSVAAEQSSGVANSSPSVNTESSNQFLWKPVSDKDGKLAVLLPARYTGKVKSLKILAGDGKTILATGRSVGVANGGREHFRFSKAGGGFPNNSTVQWKLDDGTLCTMKIDNSGKRTVKNSAS